MGEHACLHVLACARPRSPACTPPTLPNGPLLMSSRGNMSFSRKTAFRAEMPRSPSENIALRRNALNCPVPKGPSGAKRGLSVQNEACRNEQRPFSAENNASHRKPAQRYHWAV
eukprot:12522599-Alexandrium_andersonii.AAC.1